MRNISLYLIIIIATLLAGCSGEERVYRIGVSQCAAGPWREKVNREMLAAQHLYEQNVEVTICDARDNPQLQIRQIDSLAQTGIDLLVVAPTESAPMAEAVAQVRGRGIPVIFFDRKADTDDYDAFIGGDNVVAGSVVAGYAAELARQVAGHRPVVLEITAAMTTSPAQERHAGFEQVMQQHPEIDYVCMNSDWSAEKTYQILKRQIAAGHQPDIVFCHNDANGLGAYKAAKEAGLAEAISVLGIDGMPDEGIAFVQKGYLAGTYVYPTHGEQIVRLALNILTGRPFERDNDLQSVMVTPRNVDIISLNSRELIRQNEDLITIHDKLEQYFGLYNAQHKMLMASLVVIAFLVVAVLLTWRAFAQMRKALHERQTMHEEQTLFYTNPDSRTLRQVFETPQEELPAPRSQDTIFAETLNEAIRKNMANANLKMDELGETVGLSRVQLYRKVKAITGLTPVELLRQMRLQQGYVLLTTTTKTVNEIAYEVGFGTPGYFSKCFKQQYGKYPSDLRQTQ